MLGTYPVVIATWSFGLAAAQTAWRILRDCGDALDAIEAGISSCEDDESVTSVGYGGLPDASGVVTLDASVMDHDRRCGAVAGVKRFRNPIRIARRVMEQTPHVLLVGEGADAFAERQGFAAADLLSPAAKAAYLKRSQDRSHESPPNVETHDTIGMLAIDAYGKMAGGCSTSGTAWKVPGRVGDSPIIGAGLYVDGAIGAATATGVGEIALRSCASFQIVDRMSRGALPGEAIRDVFRKLPIATELGGDISFIALRSDGAFAGMSLRREANFQYALIRDDDNRLIDASVFS